MHKRIEPLAIREAILTMDLTSALSRQIVRFAEKHPDVSMSTIMAAMTNVASDLCLILLMACDEMRCKNGQEGRSTTIGTYVN